MALHDELIDQAGHLLTGPFGAVGGPGDGSLRRAISTAYYALFHFLVADATAVMCPARPVALAMRFRRAFGHKEMKDVCGSVAKSRVDNLVDALKPLFGDPIEPGLHNLSKIFVELQDARHLADYDVYAPVTFANAESAVINARSAIVDWQPVSGTDNAQAFLAALLLNKYWNRG